MDFLTNNLCLCPGLLAFLVFIVIIFVVARQQRQKWEEGWVDFARRTGLSYESTTLKELEKESKTNRKFFRVGPPQTPPQVAGQWRGFHVFVDAVSFSQGSVEDGGNLTRWFTRFNVMMPNPRGGRVMLRTLYLRKPRRFNAPELTEQMRNETTVDSNLRVWGEPVSYVRSAVESASLTKQLLQRKVAFELSRDHESVSLVVEDLEKDPAVMEWYLELAVYWASILASIEGR